jgi:hypothetical protein
MSEFGIIDVPDANVVSALLNWRVVLQPFNFLVRVPSAKPVVRGNVPDHMDLIRRTAMYLDRSCSGFNLQIDMPIHL